MEDIKKKLLKIEDEIKIENTDEKIASFIEHLREIYPKYKIISYSIVKNIIRIKFLINDEKLIISGNVNNLEFLEWHIKKTIAEYLKRLKKGDIVRVKGNRFLGKVLEVRGDKVTVELENGYVIVVERKFVEKI